MYREKKKYGQDPTVPVRAKTTFEAPLRWAAPKRIFTCSWSDFFIEEADAWRADAWEIIRRTPHHRYMILTKRPTRITDHLPSAWPFQHVWLGVSVENQTHADERIPWLLKTPATVRFLSVEPLLGAVDLERFMGLDFVRTGDVLMGHPLLRRIQWVIVGGESGGPPERALVSRCNSDDPHSCRDALGGTGASHYHAKPEALKWVRALRDQCVAAGVPFFFKQWGGATAKSGGRLLDGRTWDELPVG